MKMPFRYGFPWNTEYILSAISLENNGIMRVVLSEVIIHYSTWLPQRKWCHWWNKGIVGVIEEKQTIFGPVELRCKWQRPIQMVQNHNYPPKYNYYQSEYYYEEILQQRNTSEIHSSYWNENCMSISMTKSLIYIVYVYYFL